MRFFIWVVILGLIQSVVFFDLQINFLVLLCVFAGMRGGPLAGLLTGASIGIFAEVLSSSDIGLGLALYSAAGLLSGVLKSQVYYKEGFLTEMLFSFFGVLFFYSGHFVFTKIIQPGAFFTAILSAIVAPALFRVVGREVNPS